MSTVRQLFEHYTKAEAALNRSRTEFATEIAANRLSLDDEVEQQFIDRIGAIPEICREVTLFPEPEPEPAPEVTPEPVPAPVEPSPETPAA